MANNTGKRLQDKGRLVVRGLLTPTEIRAGVLYMRIQVFFSVDY